MHSPFAPTVPAAGTFTGFLSSLPARISLAQAARRGALCVVFLALLSVFVAGRAGAEATLPELRLATSYRGISDVSTYSVALFRPAPRWTRASRLELNLGVIDTDESSRAFVFLGPSWRLGEGGPPPFIEFSFGPTALTGSTVGGTELGGNFHFRSALAIGTRFGARRDMEIALRVSHISNGGLRGENPGLDSIGLSFAGGIGRH